MPAHVRKGFRHLFFGLLSNTIELFPIRNNLDYIHAPWGTREIES